MAIGWYPGHMNKARKEIIHALKQVHAVIEVVDARLPYSSENPLLNELAGDKPVLKILNKADLAEDTLTKEWNAYYRDLGKTTLVLSAKSANYIKRQILDKILDIASHGKPPLKVIIVGIPNVGKSTLINNLAGTKIAKTGNEPAVTKGQQIIRLGDDVHLVDTPGILWPKIEDQESAFRLAVSGAIKNTAIELEDIALYALEFMAEKHPDRLVSRYDINVIGEEPARVLEAIGKLRGCLKKGGVDFHKAAEIVLNDIRSVKLGPLTFESPLDIKVFQEKPEQTS